MPDRLVGHRNIDYPPRPPGRHHNRGPQRDPVADIIAADTAAARGMREILTRARAELAALEFIGGLPVLGYDMPDVLSLIDDMTPGDAAAWMIEDGAREKVADDQDAADIEDIV